MNTIAATIRTRSARRTLLAALLTVAALVGLQAPQASASTRSLAGAYGGVSTPTVFAQRIYGTYSAGLQIPGPWVTRSNGSTGRQAVLLNVGVEQWKLRQPVLGERRKLQLDPCLPRAGAERRQLCDHL